MKAHRLLYHSTLGSRVIKKKKSPPVEEGHAHVTGAASWISTGVMKTLCWARPICVVN